MTDRALALATLLGLGLIAGCFSPSISDGEYRCGPQSLCPGGFVCSGTVCRRGGLDAGTSAALPVPTDLGSADVSTDLHLTDTVTGVDVPGGTSLDLHLADQPQGSD